MANGTLDLQTEDEDEPLPGVPKVHPNDDRRTPLLWLANGTGQTVVSPAERHWWLYPDYFENAVSVADFSLDALLKYDHYGCVPPRILKALARLTPPNYVARSSKVSKKSKPIEKKRGPERQR